MEDQLAALMVDQMVVEMEETNMASYKRPKTYNLHTGRKFLNAGKHHSDATLYTQVSLKDYGGDRIEFLTDFKLRDCTKLVQLSVDCYDLSSYKNSQQKLQTLVIQINEMRKALARGWNLKKKLEAKNKANAAKQARKKGKKVQEVSG